jgi:chemotaxis protein histidine kinase CheA
MNNLQKDFLERSVATLENLTESAKTPNSLAPEFLREVFRALHTIKGTAQTFGFNAPAHLAHELENLLSNPKNDSDDFKNVLLEGFALLIKSFRSPSDSKNHAAFIDKIRRLAPASEPLQNAFSLNIPTEISPKLSEFEKGIFLAALEARKNIFCVKADFDLADFAAGFKSLKEDLSAKGEIIATLPNPNVSGGKIGFLIYLATDEKEVSQKFPAEIVWQETAFSNDLDGVLSNIAAHGKDLAARQGKEIEFAISADKTELSDKNLSLIFDVLLHLVRNAADHGIEKRGKIEISLKADENDLELRVKDDGKGIDLEKIRAKATEKNLLSPDQILTETELLALIFLPAFSTSASVSEISGRGVGLDAVKNLIENAGGKISVKSLKDAGTTFEIFLRI